MASSSTGNRLIILAVLAVMILIAVMFGISRLRAYSAQVHDYDSCVEAGGELVQAVPSLPANCHHEGGVYSPLH